TSSPVPLFTALPMPLAFRTRFRTLGFLLCMLSAAGAAAAEKSILVFGDSLSAAYGIARSRGWVALLEERLKRERLDYSVVNASISGETSAGGAARINAALESRRPAVVIVELGRNAGLPGLPLAPTQAHLGALAA